MERRKFGIDLITIVIYKEVLLNKLRYSVVFKKNKNI